MLWFLTKAFLLQKNSPNLSKEFCDYLVLIYLVGKLLKYGEIVNMHVLCTS